LYIQTHVPQSMINTSNDQDYGSETKYNSVYVVGSFIS